MNGRPNEVTGRIYSDEWRNWTVESISAAPISGEYFVKFFSEDKLTGLVRDPLGLMPVYYTSCGGLKVFPTLRSAAESLPAKTINWEYIYSVLAANFTLHAQTPIREISRVPSGHLLFNNGKEWQTRPYFKELVPKPRNEFRDIFFEVIKKRALTYPNFLLSFSGGLDSSLILATLLKQNISPQAVTLIFDDPSASEAEGLASFERRWGSVFNRIEAPDIDSNIYNWEESNYYFYNPTETLFNPIFRYGRTLGVKDIWVGYGADEVFTLNSCLLSTLLLSGNFLEFVEATRQEMREGGLAQTIYSLLRELTPSYIKRALLDFVPSNVPLTIPNVIHYAKKARYARLHRKRFDQSELVERLFHSGSIAFAAEQSHELCQPLGLSFSYPYFDLELVALALDFKPRDFYRNGLNKFALRNEFRDILPFEITDRVSRQTYDNWILEVLKHQSYLENQMTTTVKQKYHLSTVAADVRPRLALNFLSQYHLKERSHEKEDLQKTPN